MNNPMVKLRPNMKKTVNNIEISDGVSVLLVTYCLKEKPNNRKRTPVLG